MPYADPASSFESSVRHLFRHWADAGTLRKNPLVRKAFADVDKLKDVELVAAVRDRVQRVAKLVCAEAEATGSEGHERHAAIVSAILASERPEATARRLGLSLRQYYRERSDACRNIALKLATPADDVRIAAWIREGAELLFRRAESLVDQGWARKAVALLDGAWRGLTSDADRFSAQFELADALVALGDMSRAERLLSYARRKVDSLAEADAANLRDRLELSSARFAMASGVDQRAGCSLESLARRHATERRCDVVALDTAIDCGLWYCSSARFDDAREMLRRASAIAERLSGTSPGRSIALDLLRAYCAEDVIDEFDGSRVRFEHVLDASTNVASMRGTLEATIGLMGYCASIGCDDPAFQLAVRGLEIAQSMEGRENLAFAAAWIATTLLKTRHWHATESLLLECQSLARTGTLHWVFLKEAQAEFFARLGRYEEAQASFEAAYTTAKRLGNRKWQAIVLRDSGMMLNRLGRREGVQSLEQALDLATHGGVGAWSRYLVYDAAAKALHDQSIARRARDLKKALTLSPPPVLAFAAKQSRAGPRALSPYLSVTTAR